MSEHVRFPVDGMTCSSCVARITRTVRMLDGVDRVKVDLGSATASVAFDPARISLAAIADAIERAGYEPRLLDAQPWIVERRGGWLARLGL
jgi:Cu+-exporting ATPase